jgi:hypothetical protein
MKLLIRLCNFLQSPVTFSHLGPNILLGAPFPNILSLSRVLSVGIKRRVVPWMSTDVSEEHRRPFLKMEAICSSETSIDIQRTTRRYSPEVSTLHNHRCENLKSYILSLCSSLNGSDQVPHPHTTVKIILLYRPVIRHSSAAHPKLQLEGTASRDWM